MIKNVKKVLVIAVLTASMAMTAACGQKAAPAAADNKEATPTAAATATPAAKKLSGEIKVDGSSTVGPIAQVAVEEFNRVQKDIKIPVGISGSGAGFKKMIAGEIDIANSSRKAKDQEIADAKAKGYELVEFQIGFDGITVVVNKANNWVNEIKVEDLKKIWEPDSKVQMWSDVNPAWPKEKIKLYGPGMDSGTMELFTEKINGKAGAIRKDYTPSEDDNVLVQGIVGDKNAMGFFGFAYYYEQKDKLKELAIDAGKGAIKSDFATIKNQTYQPLARPLFMYVRKDALEKEHVKEFVKFYLENAKKIVKAAHYVEMDDYSAELAKLK